MMRRILWLCALASCIAMIVSSVPAQVPLTGAGLGAPASGGFTPSCVPSTNFLARTSGLDLTHEQAADTLICTLNTDGVLAKLDFLHVYATSSTTNALLNWVSSSFPSTANGSPSFTTDRGYTGVDSSSTVFIDTGFNASTAAGHYSANSLNYGFWSNTSHQASVSGGNAMGANIGSPLQRINPWYSDGNAYFGTADAGGDISGVSPGSVGHFVANRSASNAGQAYHNGASFATTAGGTGALINTDVYVLNMATAGGIASGGAALQIMADHAGGSLSGGDVTNLCHALNVYLNTIGGVSSGIC